MNARRFPSILSAGLIGLALTAGGVAPADSAGAAVTSATAVTAPAVTPAPSGAGTTSTPRAHKKATKKVAKPKRAKSGAGRTHRSAPTRHRVSKKQDAPKPSTGGTEAPMGTPAAPPAA